MSDFSIVTYDINMDMRYEALIFFCTGVLIFKVKSKEK